MKVLILISFLAAFCAFVESNPDCAHYIERWNYHIKSGEDLAIREVVTQAEEFEKVIHEIKASNSPNWKNIANGFVDRIKALDHHVVSNSIGDISNTLAAVFEGFITRSEIFNGIQKNTPPNKFPMTCIKNFSEAHRIFITGENTANSKILKRVISYIDEN